MRFLSFLGLALILCLSGCLNSTTDSALTRYELPQKPGPRLCAFQCRNAFEHCSDGCNFGERACYNDTQAQSIRDYEAYAREQFLARAPADLRPRDFERSSQCVATSCRKGCKQTYDTCFKECGGTIITKSACQFLCF